MCAHVVGDERGIMSNAVITNMFIGNNALLQLKRAHLVGTERGGAVPARHRPLGARVGLVRRHLLLLNFRAARIARHHSLRAALCVAYN